VTDPHGELLHLDRPHGLALRHARLDPVSAELLAERFRALSDPVRLGLARALRGEQELCVCDLSWVAQRPQNLTSHHMKVLKGAGIVTARKHGKMTMYRLTPEGARLIDGADGAGGESAAERTPHAQPAGR
jgi:ArsR family transcriptional regulator, lead/cadmium/zinc/bismuth-responsive transcriptional repressor